MNNLNQFQTIGEIKKKTEELKFLQIEKEIEEYLK
jgi:hypothetical protein